MIMSFMECFIPLFFHKIFFFAKVKICHILFVRHFKFMNYTSFSSKLVVINLVSESDFSITKIFPKSYDQVKSIASKDISTMFVLYMFHLTVLFVNDSHLLCTCLVMLSTITNGFVFLKLKVMGSRRFLQPSRGL